MRAEIKLGISALLAILLLTTFPSTPSAQAPGTTPETALPVDLTPGEFTLPPEGSYRINESIPEAYFELRGLEGGMRLTMKIEILGVEQGRSIIELYSGDGALLKRETAVYGEGKNTSVTLVYQPSRESAGPESTQRLALKRYSGAMEYRLNLKVELVEDYAPGTGDAGSDPEAAVALPTLAENKSLRFTGSLASRDDGDDFVDCYKLRAVFSSSGDALKISLKPMGDLQVSISIYKGDYMLRSNASRSRAEPVTLSISGEWGGGREYEFLLRVDNSGGRGGGEYEVDAWIEAAHAQTSTITQTKPGQGFLNEETLRLLIVVGAAALVAISIAMLILRRRRIYRVEEVEWWGY